MSAALSRVMLRKHHRTCAKPNAPQPVSGWLIAAFCALVLTAALALDVVPWAVAAVMETAK